MRTEGREGELRRHLRRGRPARPAPPPGFSETARGPAPALWAEPPGPRSRLPAGRARRGPDSGSRHATRRRTRTGFLVAPPGGGSGEGRGRGRRRGVALVTGGRAAAAHWAGGGSGAGRGRSGLLLLLLRRRPRESRRELGRGARADMRGCGGAAREQPAGESAGGGRCGPGRWRRGRLCGPRPASRRSPGRPCEDPCPRGSRGRTGPQRGRGGEGAWVCRTGRGHGAQGAKAARGQGVRWV